jgi:hypothetical protein
MYGILGPRQTRVRLSDPKVAGGIEAITTHFLRDARQSALGRFGHRTLASGCHTAQLTVPARPGAGGCTGTIVAHVSAPTFRAWMDSTYGTPAQRKEHVIEQMQLVLQDLSDHNMHGYLALTDAQCDVYDQDLVQLVTESLDRTSFSHLKRPCSVHWEGTLVKSLQPPVLVLVVSIGFQPLAEAA